MHRKAVPWWGWGALVCACLLSIAAYPHLPPRVATHFGLNGQPNGYMPALAAVAWAPGLMAAILVVWPYLWRIDPKGSAYGQFFGTYRFLGGAVAVFILFCHGFVVALALGVLVPMKMMAAGIGLLIALISNLLPRLRANWFMGVRTPWTLSSEQVWRKTHQLAGHTGVAAGLVIASLSWFLPTALAFQALLWIILAWAACSVIASYVYFQQDARR